MFKKHVFLLYLFYIYLFIKNKEKHYLLYFLIILPLNEVLSDNNYRLPLKSFFFFYIL